MNDIKIQWHPAFIAAMNLELIQNRNDLVFEKEYNLNTKPLEIDLLVIKKGVSIQLVNEIGYLFKGHNIIEYKSPEDSLDIDDFYKTGAYASLYKAYGETVDFIKADDITVSIIREAKPEKLFKYFQEHEYVVTNPYKGIYYIKDKVLFPTQIVVTKELDRNAHRWIKALSIQLKKDDLSELLDNRQQMTKKLDREFADSVLEASIKANRQLVEELKEGDDGVISVLKEIMEPEIQASRIMGAVEGLRRLGHKDTEIETVIIESYGLTEDEASKYLQE
ncbi:MAG: hypothetical protein NC434_12205 [Ruminococcus sp.]|nr:hypothetical protein [Ruminococcus sp.]